MFLDYKPTRYEGKGFLRNLNIRIHRDVTGERCGLGWGIISCVLTSHHENDIKSSIYSNPNLCKGA